jgi:hypothetical protein
MDQFQSICFAYIMIVNLFTKLNIYVFLIALVLDTTDIQLKKIYLLHK